MPPITAILHTSNDAVVLGRALESLRPCDEILVVDHGSSDTTLRVAREYGARIRQATPEMLPSDHLSLAQHDWIFCLLPSESLTEDLEASLFEWKLLGESQALSNPAYSTTLREETSQGWREGRPTTRLVPRNWKQWEGNLPTQAANAVLLDGNLLRFR